jgi:TM2 domain-containing membrane protein YozV
MKCYTHNDVDAIGTCVECGKALCADCMVNANGRVICKDCAGRMAASGTCATGQRKEPFLAVILSLLGGLVTGSLLFSLGQLYNGQVKKFIILTVVNACIGTVAVLIYVFGGLVTYGIGCLCCLPVLALPLIIFLYELFDAYDTADRINRGELVRDWLD